LWGFISPRCTASPQSCRALLEDPACTQGNAGTSGNKARIFRHPKIGRIKATRAFGLEEVVQGHGLRVRGRAKLSIPLFLLARPHPIPKTAPSEASFAKHRADHPNHYRHRPFSDTGSGVRWTLPPTHENYHFVHRSAPTIGCWSVDVPRAIPIKKRPRLRFSRNPFPLFHAGDGVEDIQTTEDGRTWVSYFDEGVFGDTTPGQAGLVCLDSSGEGHVGSNDLAAQGYGHRRLFTHERLLQPRSLALLLHGTSRSCSWRDGKIAETCRDLSVKGSGMPSPCRGRKAFLPGGYDNRNRPSSRT